MVSAYGMCVWCVCVHVMCVCGVCVSVCVSVCVCACGVCVCWGLPITETKLNSAPSLPASQEPLGTPPSLGLDGRSAGRLVVSQESVSWSPHPRPASTPKLQFPRAGGRQGRLSGLGGSESVSRSVVSDSLCPQGL